MSAVFSDSHLQLETNQAIMKELTKTIESCVCREEKNKENQADHKASLTTDCLLYIKSFFFSLVHLLITFHTAGYSLLHTYLL